MKWILNILGGLLVLMGLVWILQGVNILPGNFMSGHIIYSVLGIIVGGLGIGLMAIANRRRKMTGGGGNPKPPQ